jgi:SNF2 family DNA or RNA helicase
MATMTMNCLLCGSEHSGECNFLDAINHTSEEISEEFQDYLDECGRYATSLLAVGETTEQEGLGESLDVQGEAASLGPIVQDPIEGEACKALILRPPMALQPYYNVDVTRASFVKGLEIKTSWIEECTEIVPPKKVPPLRFHSLSNKFHAYEFQVEGVQFIRQTGYRCLIGDKMGLGKTVQALLAIFNDLSEQSDKLPCMYIVRSSTVWQWLSMHKEWASSNPLGIFMIRGSKNFIPSGFSAYVISMDTLGRLVEFETDRWGETIPGSEKLNKWLAKLGIKTVVVDECHSFKNVDAKRSKALECFLRLAEVKYEIYLSGTAIKNRADEYYFTLHRLFPQEFRTIEGFRHQWCEKDEKGKFSRIKPYRLEEFRALISSRVLRREKGKDLPPFRRVTTVVSIENPKFKAQYNKALDELQALADSKDKLTKFDIQDNLMVLRRIVGNAKVDDAVEYVDEFLDENEEEKICIGVHHHSVRDTLYAKLMARGHTPLKLSGEDSADHKNYIVNQFKRKKNRILIISIVAGGTGIDGLQCCSNILILERQWNSADEEQFEFRFNRDGQINPVLADYMLAKGTVDDYFTKNVERTRQVFHETVENNWEERLEAAFSVREDVEEILRNRL